MIYFFVKNKSLSFKAGVDAFAIEDTTSISAVSIKSNDGETVSIKRGPGGWTLNDTLLARKDMIHNLMKALNKLTISYPVPKGMYNEVFKDLNTGAKEVNVWQGSDKPSKTILIGRITNNYEGNYAYIKGSDIPYVITMKGFEGHIDAQFVSSASNWRSHLIFDYKQEDIASVQIDYTNNPEQSFLLINKAQDITVTNDANQYEIEKDNINILVATKFLQSFTNVNAEAYQNEYVKKDSVLRNKPFAIIKLIDVHQKVNEVPIYYMPINERTKKREDNEGKPLNHDGDRYFALINGGKDFVIIQDYIFSPLFRTLNSFKKIQSK